MRYPAESLTNASSKIRRYVLCKCCSQCFDILSQLQLGVEFGSKLIRIEDENKTIKLQCVCHSL